MVDNKTCTKCGETKLLTEFFPKYGKNNKGKYNPWCKKCHGRDGVERKKRSPSSREKYAETARAYWLKRKFGITKAQYDEMFAAQGGRCALCNNESKLKVEGERKVRDLAVDHDHATGKVRGLLCDTCNRGVGLLRDDPRLLRAAADYIEAAKA